MKINVTATGEQKSFEPLPEGDYGLVFLGATEKTAKSSGNKMAIMEYQVDGTGRKVSDSIVLKDTMNWKWEQIAAAFHGPTTQGQELNIDTDQLVGQRCQAHLKIESYTNDEGEVKKVNRIGYYKVKEDPAPFKQETKSHAAPKQEEAPKAQEAAQDADDEDSDDVPF